MLLERLAYCACLFILCSCNGQGSYSGPAAGNFALNVTVSGLPVNNTTQVVVQNNASSNLTFSGNGVQSYALSSGSSYNITVATQPAPLTCSVASGSGTNNTTNPVNVSVICRQQYVYITNYGANTVSILGLGQASVLSAFATVGTGNNPRRVVIHPNGQYAYVANYTDSTISQYTLASGALTAQSVPTVSAGSSGAGPYDLAVSPNGSFLYSVNINAGTITQYSIASTGSAAGQLTQIGSPLFVGNGINSIAVDANSSFVYVTGFASALSALYTLQIQSNGALTLLSQVQNGLFSPTSVVLSPGGKFAYVINSATTTSNVYSINNGVLTFVSPFTTGSVPHTIAFTPNGANAYLTNYGGSSSPGTTLSQYSVNQSTGALTLLNAATPVASGHTGSAGPYAIVVDANGNSVFDVNYNEGSVTQYSISSASSTSSTNAGVITIATPDATSLSSPTSIAIH